MRRPRRTHAPSPVCNRPQSLIVETALVIFPVGAGGKP